ncbi:hypothetical protein Tco_0809399 [Tanacetum coccineum]
MDTTSSSAGSHSQDLSAVLQSEFRLNREVAEKAYEVKQQKDLTLMQCKELEFLTLKIGCMPKAQAALIYPKRIEIPNPKTENYVPGVLMARQRIGQCAKGCLEFSDFDLLAFFLPDICGNFNKVIKSIVDNHGLKSQTSSYYVTHPTSVVDYDDEYQQEDVHNNSEDPLVSAIKHAIIQGDRVNIQSRNFGNNGRNGRRAYVQEEVVEGMNAPKETGNVQRTLRFHLLAILQCSMLQCSEKQGHYARNCPKPRVRDLKYFIEQMLLAKQDEAGVILTNEQNDFLFAYASRMEEIEDSVEKYA